MRTNSTGAAKHIVTLTVSLCCFTFAASSQFYFHNNYRSDHQWEVDANVGLSNFLG
ncbi:MAG: hypothetical protein H7178_01375, partial [Chitinophagaceae bacterium]|nr:hypothetical protein [Chitinophagaceae bacterium]